MLLDISGATIEDGSTEWTEVVDTLDNLSIELSDEYETTSTVIEAPEELEIRFLEAGQDNVPEFVEEAPKLDPKGDGHDYPDYSLLDVTLEDPSRQTDILLDTAQQPRSNEVPQPHNRPRSAAGNAQYPAEDPSTDKPQWTGAQSFYGNNSPEMQQPIPTINIPTFNILLLGQTQSGKSTLLQAIRNYADPDCEIDEESIGNGNSSHTKKVQTQLVETNFPEYRLYGKGIYHKLNPRNYIVLPSQQEPVEKEVNFSEFIGHCTAKEFQKKIHRTEGLSVRKDEYSHSPQSIIRIFDTPGLDDTDGHDERNVAELLSALSTAGDIHLVLITITTGAMTPGLRAALTTYSNIFSSMGGLIAFVHTRVDFDTHHVGNTKLTSFLEERKRDLLIIMGRDIPQYLIDCQLDEWRPVHIYLRQRMIRSLLLLARLNAPVSLKKMQLYKTKKMLEVDAFIHVELKKTLVGVQNKMEAVKEKMRYAAEKVIFDMHLRGIEIRFDIRELEEYIRNNDTDDLELIHEDHFGENWELFSFRQETVLTCQPLKYTIDSIHEDMTGIEIKDRHGGKGCTYWRVKMVRQFFQEGTYHAKLYAQRRKINHEKIERAKAEMRIQRKDLEMLILQHNAAKQADESVMADESTKAERQQLENDQSRCLDMITRASRPTLHLNLFRAIAEAGVYDGTTIADCKDKAMEFYSTYIPAEGEEVPLEQDEMPHRGPQSSATLKSD